MKQKFEHTPTVGANDVKTLSIQFKSIAGSRGVEFLDSVAGPWHALIKSANTNRQQENVWQSARCKLRIN